MKHYSKLFKRVQAWVLTVAMLLPLVNSGLLLGISAADETLPVRDKVVTTEGKIVADNYELSEAEEALLASGLLAGVTHTVAVPNEGDELVSVNQDTHAIKAVEWTDANGYVWKPVAVRIMVGEDEKETVTLTNGEGTYVYDGNAFSVHVDYEVCVDVSVDTQTKLWNAAANLTATAIWMAMIGRLWTCWRRLLMLRSLFVLLAGSSFLWASPMTMQKRLLLLCVSR